MTFNEINNQADIGDGFMLYANSGIVAKPEENVEDQPTSKPSSTHHSSKKHSNNNVYYKDKADEVINDSTKKDEEQVITIIQFNDITNHWAQKEIEYLASKGIVIGIGNHQFGPNKGMKACDFKTLLSRVYSGEITIGQLRDGQFLTRVQLAVMVKENIAPEEKVDTSKLLAQFKDIQGLTAHEIEALAYMYEQGVLKGVSQTEIAPQELVTRAQVATIITRLLSEATSNQAM